MLKRLGSFTLAPINTVSWLKNVGLSLYWRYLQSAQGLGVGRLLINAAEDWSKEQGYRLLHLEVFANNDKAQRFYDNLGFEAETLQMVKVL